MMPRPPRSTLFPLHDALPISLGSRTPPEYAVYVLPDFVEKLTGTRSEEHTSELQSQSNIVCRLLLEKKKNLIPLKSLRVWFSVICISITTILNGRGWLTVLRL